jgi:hypothetical protein
VVPEGKLLREELAVNRIKVAVAKHPAFVRGQILPELALRLEVSSTDLHRPDLSGQTGSGAPDPTGARLLLHERPGFIEFERVPKINGHKRLLQRRKRFYGFYKSA